jgi:predicted dehydrogenase
MPKNVRVGIIGAGNWTVSRILPGFVKQDGVQVTHVANRSVASGQKVAAQFKIPNVTDDWRQVIASDVDAVFIGTPPYAHEETTVAALEAGKHVLLQTRMSKTAEEARRIYAAAQQAHRRGVKTMLVPPGPFHTGIRYIRHLVESGYLGTLRHVQAFNVNASMADPKAPLSNGRNDMTMYGRANAMQLGLTYDVVQNWTGAATRVLSQRMNFVTERPQTPDGPMARNPFPDEVTVLAETDSGALASLVVNYSIHFGESRIELYGSEGTVVYKAKGDVVLGARAGEPELKPLAIPAEHTGAWRCEEEFIQLVRGEIAEPSFTFQHGVKNMEFLEACYRSAMEGGWVLV